MDENAPPGYLSPFGLLAGIRNMLPGSGKDQQTQDSESPNRSVLKNMNSSDGPKPKNLLNVAQGAEGTAPPSPASLSGDCSQISSPGQGERRSVASDTSFVSAVSGISRTDRLESDNDASSDSCFDTSYVSAAETSAGNLSILGDQFSKLVLNSPAPHSNLLNGSSESHPVKPLSAWPSEKFSADDTITLDKDPAFGLTEKEEQLHSLEEGNSLPGNQTCSGFSHSDFDATFETVHENDIVNETQVINEATVASESADIDDSTAADGLDITLEDTENTAACLSDKHPVDGGFNSTFNSSNIIASSNDLPITSNEISSKDDLSQAGGLKCVNSDIPDTSETPNINATFDGVSVSNEKNLTEILSEDDLSKAGGLECVKSDIPETSETANINATFDGVSVSNEKNLTEILSEDDLSKAGGLECVKSDIPETSETANINATFDGVSVSNEKNLTEILSEDDLSKAGGLECVKSDIPETSETANINATFDGVSVSNEENSTGNETVTTEDLNNSECRDYVNETQVLSQEDICEAKEVNSPAHSEIEGVNQDLSHHTQSAEDIPIPIRKPRTFEEILAAELAAQSDPEQAVPSFSGGHSDPVATVVDSKNTAGCSTEECAIEGGLNSATDTSESPTNISSTSDGAQVAVEENLTVETHSQGISLECESSDLPDTAGNSEVNVTFDGAQSGLGENFSGNITATIEDENVLPEVNETEIEPEASFSHITEVDAIPSQSDTVSEKLDISHHAQSPEDVPIPIRKPRTFEEILAAELAAQSDPEQAVPSFSAASTKLDESFAKIISADTSPLESECEPDLVLETAPAELELESEADSGLDSLIKRSKHQERVLEDDNIQSMSEVASKISSSYLNESEGTSDELESPDCANRTVIDLQANSPTNSEVPEGKVQVGDLLSNSTEGENFEEEFKSGDAFKDPSAFDFLSLHGCTRSARDLRKESLYLKFDPLVGITNSPVRANKPLIMHPENSTEAQAGAAGGEEQALNTSLKLVSLSPSASKKHAEDTTQDATLITPVKTPSHKGTPVKTPAHIMLNETLESIGSRGTIVKQEDLIKKLQEYQTVLEEQDKAYQERISELEQKLQEIHIHHADDIKKKDKEIQEKVQSLSELNVIMKEYERTISRMVAEKSQEKTGFEEKQTELIKDRDQALQHLNNMEIAFSDIHTKYERLKSVLTALKKNEETLLAAVDEKQENFDKMQNMYDMLKSHAVSKLEKANQDLEAIKQKHQQENSKLKAMVKKLEVKTKSLEEALGQKVKENQALTAICDELISKVGE